MLAVPCLFFFTDTAPTETHTLSLHDALPILNTSNANTAAMTARIVIVTGAFRISRSEEHTSELQSPCNLVCRLLLEKKKNATMTITATSTNRYRFFESSLSIL